jgi:predicted nucleic acid-binding protein
LRVFLDANILFLAGYSSTSPVHDLLALAACGDCELLSSDYAFEEARRNLLVKAPPGALARFEKATAIVIHVREAGAAVLERAQAIALSDSADIPILAAAFQADADALVTGDRRAFGAYFGQRIGLLKIMLLRDAILELLNERR